MDMTLRWYGPGYDSVTLKQIRQIPGVKNVITTLFGKQAGERWLPGWESLVLNLLMCQMILRLAQLRQMSTLTII